jgi:hypothetical protein
LREQREEHERQIREVFAQFPDDCDIEWTEPIPRITLADKKRNQFVHSEPRLWLPDLAPFPDTNPYQPSIEELLALLQVDFHESLTLLVMMKRKLF